MPLEAENNIQEKPESNIHKAIEKLKKLSEYVDGPTQDEYTLQRMMPAIKRDIDEIIAMLEQE